jgi:hypothetical protein
MQGLHMETNTASDCDHRIITAVSIALGGEIGRSDDLIRLRRQVEDGDSEDKLKTACEIAIAFIRWSQDLKRERDETRNLDRRPASGRSRESVIKQFCERLDQLPKDARIEAIDDAVHRLQFERRWQQMVPNQIKHMCDESLSDAESEALAACKTETEREDRINMYARARYFRRCHWQMYLNGESMEPPVEADFSV